VQADFDPSDIRDRVERTRLADERDTKITRSRTMLRIAGSCERRQRQAREHQ
jgi:hypothetical protein